MTSAVRVRVYHSNYGCDTGCCGHMVELKMPDGTLRESFEFKHPDGQKADDWARKLVEDVVRSEWPTCFDALDWKSLTFEVSDSC